MNIMSRRPREISTLATDFRPPEVRAAEDAIALLKLESEATPIGTHLREGCNVDDQEADGPMCPSSASTDPLDEIALLIRSLTYGEMMELATALWNCRGDGIEEQGLPATLHRWSTSRG